MKRSHLFSVLGLAVFLILVPYASAAPQAQTTAKAPATGKQVATKTSVAVKSPERHGYTIFRETMVDMSWPEVKKAAESNALVILPVAVIEEHGPHMSLGSDTYLVYQACKMIKQRLAADNINAVIVPPVYWGIMQKGETGDYPGSFTIQPSTMKALLVDILADLKTWGFRNVYALNFHGDRTHIRIFEEAMAEGREKLGLNIYDPKIHDVVKPQVRYYKVDKPFAPDYHAGAPETAAMLKFFPEEVNVSLAKTLKPEGSFHPLGYMGDPANHANANPALAEAVAVPAAENIKLWLKASANKTP